MIYLRKGDTPATRTYCFPNGYELIMIIQVGKAHNKIWPPEFDYIYAGSIIRTQQETLWCLSINSCGGTRNHDGCPMGVRDLL